MPPFHAFIGGSNETQARMLNREQSINLYFERAQSKGAKTPGSLIGTPGYSTFADVVADNGGRGSIVASGRYFCVVGGNFYEVTAAGVVTQRNTSACTNDGNPAILVYNGVIGGQIGIASGTNFFVFTLATNVWAQIAALNGLATHFAVANNYGLVFNSATGIVKLSTLNDLTSGYAVSFTRSLLPDPWQAMTVDTNNLIWLWGPSSFEVWQYVQGTSSTQPFAPYPGLTGRHGIASAYGYTVNEFGLFWLSSNPEGPGQVMSSSGGAAPRPVSTFAIDSQIAGFLAAGGVANVELLSYKQEGHVFVACQFPSAPATKVFDVTENQWHDRGAWSQTTGTYGLWSPRCQTYAFGKNLILDRTTSLISSLDLTSNAEIDGTPIRRVRRAPAFTNEHKRDRINDLELLMDVGLGTQSGQGQYPVATLRVSVNGGISFGNERQAGIGAAGDYRKRVYWTRLGSPPDCCFEVVFADGTPVRISDAYVNNFRKVA